MPVTLEENAKYGEFVRAKAQELGCLDYQPEDIVWHYTDGPGFLGIIESSTIFATQVASLNDRNETKYAADLFKVSIRQVMEENKDSAAAQRFLERVLEYVKDNPDSPVHGTSKFYVACFSSEADDWPQWKAYGRENGYAIGFYARGFWREPTSWLYRVVYDRALQEKAAKEIAEATLKFFLEGLTNPAQGARTQDPDKWAEEFFLAWDEWVYKLAPLAKDAAWKAERELRLVHELKGDEFSQVRFKQRKTMLARYIPLATTNWVQRRTPLLPIAKIMVGPGNQLSFTSISVRLLLNQMGYPEIPVETSKVTLQNV